MRKMWKATLFFQPKDSYIGFRRAAHAAEIAMSDLLRGFVDALCSKEDRATILRIIKKHIPAPEPG